MNTLKGDYVVAGMVTGTHVIEDIGVPVPHQVAVRIPVDVALKSKDLWRGIQQNRLFLLTGGVFVSPSPENQGVPVSNNASAEEIQRLCQELGAAKKDNEALRKTLQAQEGKLEAILSAIGGLGQGLVAIPVANVKASVEAVGGEVPMYIPSEGIKPKDTETNLQVVENTLEGDSVADAAQKLKRLRGKA